MVFFLFVIVVQMLNRKTNVESRIGGVKILARSFSYFTTSFRRPFELRLGASGLIRLWSYHRTGTPTHCCHTTKEAVQLRFPSLCDGTIKINCPQR